MPGPPRRSFDIDMLEKLMDIRIQEQLPWKALPDRFMELRPEGSKESKPDWRVLQRELMNDVDAHILPTRVHRRMRTRLKEEFSKADLGAMLMSILLSQYGEWNMLHGKMLRYAASVGVNDEADEKVSVSKFIKSDRNRMDFLADKIVASLFKIADIMRTVHLSDSSLLELVDGVKHGEVESSTTPAISPAEVAAQTKEAIESVKKVSVGMLEEINAAHRKEGVGHYRVVEEEEEDEELVE